MSVIWSGVTEEGAVVPVQVTPEGKVVAVGDGPQGDYLPTTGGELTGPLTSTSTASFTGSVSTDSNIAAGGNASIEGNVSAGYGDPSTGCLLSANGSASFGGGDLTITSSGRLNSTEINAYGTAGFIANNSPGSGGFAWRGVNASGTNTSQIDYDGNVTLGGNIIAGSTGLLKVQNGAANNPVFQGFNSGVFDPSNKKIEFLANGSASFAGGNCGFTSEGELIFTSRNTRYKLVVSDGFLFPEPYTLKMELKEKAEQKGGVSMDIEDPQ